MAIPTPSQLPYVNLTELKSYLSISDTDTSQDFFLASLTRQVQRFIDRYTGRTFGWGDQNTNVGGLYDSTNIDYSNTDNIGINAPPTIVGNLLTLNTQGPIPWTAGENVSLFAMQNLAYNGVWAIETVNNPTQIVVNVGVSTGALGLSALQAITNNPVGAANGYVGNYVTNYKYRSQEQYDGLVGKTIYLRNMDIRSIDTLFIGLRNIANPVLLDHTQYVWRDDGRIILGGAYFNSWDSAVYSEANDNSFYGTIAAGYQTITVSYWYGYVGVPEDIKLAALDVCTALYTLRKSLGIQSEKVGDYDVRYDLTIRKALATQPDSLDILNRMRRRRIG